MPSAYSSVCASVLLFSSLAVLGTANAGIHLGDPLASRARMDGGIQIDWWELPLSEAVLTPCAGGSDVHHTLNDTLSATNGLELPLGSWCYVVLVPSGDFVLSGSTPDNYDLDITLDVGNILLDPTSDLSIISGTSTETALVELLGLDWWDNQVAPYVGSGSAVSIYPGHARHSALVGSMQNASSLVVAPL